MSLEHENEYIYKGFTLRVIFYFSLFRISMYFKLP